jgi:hypothetical protein
VQKVAVLKAPHSEKTIGNAIFCHWYCFVVNDQFQKLAKTVAINLFIPLFFK